MARVHEFTRAYSQIRTDRVNTVYYDKQYTFTNNQCYCHTNRLTNTITIAGFTRNSLCRHSYPSCLQLSWIFTNSHLKNLILVTLGRSAVQLNIILHRIIFLGSYEKAILQAVVLRYRKSFPDRLSSLSVQSQYLTTRFSFSQYNVTLTIFLLITIHCDPDHISFDQITLWPW